MVVNLKDSSESTVEQKHRRAIRGPAKVLLTLVFLGILATLLLAISLNSPADRQVGSRPGQGVR